MEIKEAVSIGKSHQSMETKDTCILVVNDDLTCNNIVAEMLQHCTHQVLHIGGILDVLNAIWESKESLDLVLTNAHKLESNGIEIVRHIQKKLNLPIILMCPDKMKIVSKLGHACTFAAYVLKGLGKNDVNNLWQFALQKEIRLGCAKEEDDRCAARSPPMANIHIVAETRKRKARGRSGERSTTSEDSKEEYDHHHHPHTRKKPRVIWTVDMHQKFLEAFEILGYDKAVPKKIVEVMGIPGLTRENVASHLQKFRGSLRRSQEAKQLDAIHAIPSPSTSRNTYISMLEDKLSLGTTSGTDHYMLCRDLSLSSDFRTYGDHLMKYMATNIRKTTSFAGYRLTSDGNSIEYGNSVEAKSTNDQETASIEALGKAALPQNSSGKDTPPSSVLPQDHDFSIPPLEIMRGDDPTDQNPVEGLSQGHYSPAQVMQYLDDLLEQDDDMVEGTSSSYMFEWEDFDDTFFKTDD